MQDFPAETISHIERAESFLSTQLIRHEIRRPHAVRVLWDIQLCAYPFGQSLLGFAFQIQADLAINPVNSFLITRLRLAAQ
jgi:hypothetical protein